MSQLAPIVLFVFRRPEHTARVLESLAHNEELARSELHIYCEGPRNDADVPMVEATRLVVKNHARAGKVRIVEREHNLGCAASIIAGIDEVLTQHDRIIVLEDDLVVSPHFLNYMNSALSRYGESDKVMHVSGYAFCRAPGQTSRAVMLPFVASWGWATWRRAWSHFDRDLGSLPWLDRYWWRRFRFDLYGAFPYRKMVGQYLRNEIDAWDIRWYLSVFRRNGLCVYPTESLVLNNGHDGSGTHQMPELNWRPSGLMKDAGQVASWSKARVDRTIFDLVIAELSRDESLWRRLRRHWCAT